MTTATRTTCTVRTQSGVTLFRSVAKRGAQLTCRNWVRRNLPRSAGVSISRETTTAAE